MLESRNGPGVIECANKDGKKVLTNLFRQNIVSLILNRKKNYFIAQSAPLCCSSKASTFNYWRVDGKTPM